MERARDPPLLQRLAESGAACSPRSGPQVVDGAKPGIFGMLKDSFSSFMFSPPERSPKHSETGSVSTSAGNTQTCSLPKSESQVSFCSEYFGDADLAELDYGDPLAPDSDDEAGNASPRTPAMRRNGGSFGSFGSFNSSVAQV